MSVVHPNPTDTVDHEGVEDQGDTKSAVRELIPNRTLDQEGVKAEKAHAQMMVRKGYKSNFTRLCNEIRSLMVNPQNKNLIEQSVQKLRGMHVSLRNAAIAYADMLEVEAEKYKADAYVVVVDETMQEMEEEVVDWGKTVKDTPQVPAVAPEDAASNAGSSTSSARARASAKKAGLLAKAAMLSRQRQLDEAELELRHRKAVLEVDTELAIATAEEETYQRFEDSMDLPAARDIKREEHTYFNPLGPMFPVRQPEPAGLNPTAPIFHVRQREEPPVCKQEPLTTVDNSVLHYLQQGQQQQLQMFQALQLPRTELPDFHGDPLQYWVFIRAFENSVTGSAIGDGAKLTRLLHYCKGSARKVIECCVVMPPERGYPKAMSLLKDRFGDECHSRSLAEQDYTGAMCKATR